MIFIPRFAEIWGPTSMCGSARALYRALVRPEGRAIISQYGEPAKLCQDEPATTSSARFISTSDADEPPQKCGTRYRGLLAAKAHRAVCLSLTRSGDFRLSPPANVANSAICPTEQISTFLCNISSSIKSKDSSNQCPSVPTGEEQSSLLTSSQPEPKCLICRKLT